MELLNHDTTKDWSKEKKINYTEEYTKNVAKEFFERFRDNPNYWGPRLTWERFAEVFKGVVSSTTIINLPFETDEEFNDSVVEIANKELKRLVNEHISEKQQ